MRRLAALLLVLALPPGTRAEPPPAYTFALIGDTPYSTFERTHLPELLARIADSGAAFIVHVGDIKAGSAPCSDALLEDRLALFDRQPLPFILTPGDNEWTDCARPAAGGFDPLERLDWLRRHFFPPGRSLGQNPIAVTSQADAPGFPAYRENLRWQRGPVLFATLNLPGGDNHRGRRHHPNTEYVERQAANKAWLDETFRLALQARVGAVVLLFQADPGFEDYAERRPDTGYREFLDQLLAATLAFPGEVVAVHGDSHTQRIDHPLRNPNTGDPIPRFTRVETFGYPFMGWVRVTVAPTRQPILKFEAEAFAPARQP